MGGVFDMSCSTCCGDTSHCIYCETPPPNAYLVHLGGVIEGSSGCPSGTGACADFNADWVVCRRVLPGIPPLLQKQYCIWRTQRAARFQQIQFAGECVADVMDFCYTGGGVPFIQVSVRGAQPGDLDPRNDLLVEVWENSLLAADFFRKLDTTFDSRGSLSDCWVEILGNVPLRSHNLGGLCDFSLATMSIIEAISD